MIVATVAKGIANLWRRAFGSETKTKQPVKAEPLSCASDDRVSSQDTNPGFSGLGATNIMIGRLSSGPASSLDSGVSSRSETPPALDGNQSTGAPKSTSDGLAASVIAARSGFAKR